MPQASITINAVAGSNTNLPINTLVQLNNQNIGGELSYLWAILDQPPGTAVVLSSTSIQNPTFTPTKEGTYLIKLTVNQGLATEQSQTVVAAVLQLKTLERIPAASETIESDTSDGWATANNSMLRRMDRLLADPALTFGVNSSGGNLAFGDVVRVTSSQLIKVGLPGQESVPGFVKALATTATDLDELLAVVIGTPAGASPVANGALMQVKLWGQVLALPLGAGAVGDTVYVSDTGTISTSAGTNRRRVGSIMAVSGGNRDVWFDGVGGQDITPIDRRYLIHGAPGTLTDAVRVDGTNATGVTTPVRFKAGDVSTVALQVQGFAAGTDLQQWLSSGGSVLARFTNAGVLTLDAEGLSIPTAGKHITFGNVNQQVTWPGTTYLTSPAADGIGAYFGSANDYALLFKAAGLVGAQYVNNGGATLWTAAAAASASIAVVTNHPLDFQTNAVNRWRIAATGELQAQGGNRAVQNVLDPVNNQDAATKNYVDVYHTPTNYVQNGRFDFWQRGTNITTTGARVFVADRWSVVCGSTTGNVTVTQSSSVPDHCRYSCVVQRPNADTGTNTRYLTQEVDRDSVFLLRGSRVRLVFWAKKGANFSGASDSLFITVSTGTVESGVYAPSGYTGSALPLSTSVTLTTSWQKFTTHATADISATALAMAAAFSYSPVGTAGADDTFAVTGVMLLNESTAADTFGPDVSEPFIYAGGSYATDLMECQRRYEKSYDLFTNPATNTSVGAFEATIASDGGLIPRVAFQVRKRATPTITFYRIAGTSGSWNEAGGGFPTMSDNATGETGFTATPSGYTGADVDKHVYGHWTAEAEI